MNIKKIEDFIKACSVNRKGRFLLIRRKICGNSTIAEFRIIKRPTERYLNDFQTKKYFVFGTPILSVYDLIGFEPQTLINVIFAKGKLEGCYYFPQRTGRALFYAKTDIYRLRFEERPDVRRKKDEIIERLLFRAEENEFARSWPAFKRKYETARDLARSVRREIYTIFRFLSDTDLRCISRELFGGICLGKFGGDGRRLIEMQRTINKLINYNEQLEGRTKEICEFLYETENSFAEKRRTYELPDVYRVSCGVTYKNVIDLIDSARFGQKHRKQTTIKQQ